MYFNYIYSPKKSFILMKGSRPFCVSMCQGFGLASRSDTLPCNTYRWRSKSNSRKTKYRMPECRCPAMLIEWYIVYELLTCESPRTASLKSL